MGRTLDSISGEEEGERQLCLLPMLSRGSRSLLFAVMENLFARDPEALHLQHGVPGSSFPFEAFRF